MGLNSKEVLYYEKGYEKESEYIAYYRRYVINCFVIQLQLCD